MHIFKNISSSLWRHISWNKTDTLAIRRDIISSNTKTRHWPRNKTIGEDGPSWSFKEGDVPWILKKDDLSIAKDIILGVKEPSLYGSTLHYVTVDENLSGLKSHGHMKLLRVCMLNTQFLFYIDASKNMLCTHSFMEINDVCVYFVVSLSFSRVGLCEP